VPFGPWAFLYLRLRPQTACAQRGLRPSGSRHSLRSAL